MIPLLIPVRPDHGCRDALREWTRNYWAENLPDLKPVEGHHLDGPFNRSAAVNTAARAAGEWDVAVVGDSDVVCDPKQLTAAIDRARETGRCTLAYDTYIALNEPMTARILTGFDGNWLPGKALKMVSHVSSLVVVPRRLWDEVGGFDERFVGWGHDDVAFAEACRVIGGGIERVPGTVWHLFHPHSPERKGGPDLRACAALAKRYHAAKDPRQMRAIIAERSTPGICMVVITDGRRECISRSIPRALDRLKGMPIQRVVICDDSGDREYHAWLRVTFPDHELVLSARRTGFAGNTRRAWDVGLGSGQPWVFWLEDDFMLERDVDLAAMARALEDNPQVAQMALRRQAWFKPELDAGGIIEQDPAAYEDRDGWLEHRKFWTTNPHLVHRSTLASYEWPNRAHSEAAFARQVLKVRTSGYWGTRHDDPWVTHVGERTGTGY